MKKSLTVSAMAAGIALMAGPALAHDHDTGVYGTAGYTHFDGDGAAVGGITGRLGYKFNPNFGIEGEASFGVNDDEVVVLGTRVDVELDNAFGVYGVGFLPVSEKFEFLGRIGYQSTEVTGSALGVTVSDEFDGLAVGVGGQFWASEKFGIRGEYTRLEGDDAESDSFSISGVVKF